MQRAFFVGFGHVERDVGGQRGFAHRRAARKDQKVRAVQPAKFLVHVDQASGDTRQAAIALIGGVGDVDRVGDGLEEALEAAFCLALFGQFIEVLFGLHDLFARLRGDIDIGRFGRDVAAQLDEVTAHGEIIDHLCVVTHRKGGDRRPCKAGEIGRTAEFFEALVVFHKRLERYRGGEVVFGNALGRDVKDARVHGVVKVLGADDGGHAVIDVIVGQDRAQKLLFSLS